MIMQNLREFLVLYLAEAWRRKWYAIGAAWAVCVFGWVALEFVPDVYESNARLFVDTDAVLFPLLKGIAVDTSSTNKIEILQKNMLSHDNIDQLVTIVFPTIAPGPTADRERLIRRLAKEIQVTSQERNLFTVTYTDRDPRVARDVVKTAISTFLSSQTGTSHAQMNDAQQFLRQQIDTYERQLTDAENRRAQYLAEHTDVLQGEGNFAAHLASARAALTAAETERADAKVRLHILRQEIAGIPKLLSVDAVSTITGAPSSVSQRLAEAEQNLTKLRLRFTEAYPDVRAAEQLVTTLRAEAANIGGPANSTDPRGSGRSISNPVYEQVRLRIVEAETNIASLDIKISNAKTSVNHLEELAREAPAVEAEYKRLDRDYTVLKSNHDELLSRLESARIAAAADATADNRKLQIIDQPRIGQLPIGPKRRLFTSLVLCAGLSAGIAVVAGLKYLDRSFNTPLTLNEFQRPVLGGISLLIDDFARRRAFNSMIAFALVAVSLFFVYGGLVVYAV
jgi:polysaccharide chain length determinant protein (PEP-CTERM system associated)